MKTGTNTLRLKTADLGWRHIAALCVLQSAFSLGVWAQPSVFTHQGRLHEAGSPANGLYDLQFSLFADIVGGSALA